MTWMEAYNNERVTVRLTESSLLWLATELSLRHHGSSRVPLSLSQAA
jgi:hypothetical protein